MKPFKIAALVVLAVIAAFVASQLTTHRDPTLAFLRTEGIGRKANLIPAIVQAKTPRSVFAAHFEDLGFRSIQLRPTPPSEHYADEAWSLTNLLWLYTVYVNYDDERNIAEAWGVAYRPGSK